MTVLLWIVLSGVVMSAIALVGSVTLMLRESTLQRLLLPLVASPPGRWSGVRSSKCSPRRSSGAHR
ncbi:MAG: hypothetical protein JNJ54_32425 [Myxococcaceae bacterium]|nr:hypothetical protein [Myxococcaceae bacterium]